MTQAGAYSARRAHSVRKLLPKDSYFISVDLTLTISNGLQSGIKKSLESRRHQSLWLKTALKTGYAVEE